MGDVIVETAFENSAAMYIGHMAERRAIATTGGSVIAPKLAALPELCRRFGVRRLDLFGSATDNRFDPERSDIDFFVEFEPLAPGEYADAYFGLQEGLEALFGREIDLVTEPALKNPYLRRRIIAERRTLFAAR